MLRPHAPVRTDCARALAMRMDRAQQTSCLLPADREMSADRKLREGKGKKRSLGRDSNKV